MHLYKVCVCDCDVCLRIYNSHMVSLQLEDINASLYVVKCDAVLNRSRHKQGDKQKKMTKFCNGICLFFILICVIWAPMLVRT